MQVNLDLHEVSWLLDACFRGSHVRSATITQCVDKWWELMTERERMQLLEWTVRITYGGKFNPHPECCGQDTIFMRRFHPENQYMVKVKYIPDEGGHTKTEKLRAYIMNGEYYVTSTRTILEECIVKVEKIDLSEQWEELKQNGIDYDTNIIK